MKSSVWVYDIPSRRKSFFSFSTLLFHVKFVKFLHANNMWDFTSLTEQDISDKQVDSFF